MPVDVFDAAPSVGGLATSLDLWGQRVDLGSHVFIPHDPRVAAVWAEVIGNDYRLVPLRRGIWSQGRVFAYPMGLGDVIRNLPVTSTCRCALGYLASRARATPRRDDDSAESWIVRRFGRPLFDLFFREYGEKLWGLPCKEIDPDFAVELLGNINRPSLRHYFSRRIVQAAGDTPTMGPPRVQYPRGGIGEFSRRLAARIRNGFGTIHLSTRIERVVVSGSRVEGLQIDGALAKYDSVISSMPLSILARTLDEAPASVTRSAQQLTSRSTVLVYLLVTAREPFPYNWLHVYNMNFKVGRITNFGMWRDEADTGPDTIVSMEYWCSDRDAVWAMPDSDIVLLASTELSRTGLVASGLIREGRVYRVRGAHPVYTRGYKQRVRHIRDFIDSIDGLLTIGRHGTVSFNGISDSVLGGLEAARQIGSRGSGVGLTGTCRDL